MDQFPASITSLPEEVLLKILECLDVQSLGRIARTSKMFRNIVYSEDCIWRKHSKFVLGSNMSATPMQKRCRPGLRFRKRCEISKMWLSGLGRDKIILRYRKNMPWMCLDEDNLFISKEKEIFKFTRDHFGKVVTDKIKAVSISRENDISKFAINDDEIVAAGVGRQGILARLRKCDLRSIHALVAHRRDILCVDIKRDIIISGSKDCSIKIWKAYPSDTVLQKEIDMKIRTLSVALMPSNMNFIVGTPGTNNIHPLQLFDLEKGECISMFGENYKFGAGVLDIYPEFENTFLSCGYDTYIRLWDVRCPKNCVREWMEPFDNAIYCVKSDHNITIVTGAGRDGIIHVWDKRAREIMRLYHISSNHSPIYSLAFDATHVFAASDSSLHQYSYVCLSEQSHYVYTEEISIIRCDAVPVFLKLWKRCT